MKTFSPCFILIVTVISIGLFAVIGCDKDDESDATNPIEKSYFKIQDALYVEENIPQPTTNAESVTVNINRNMLAGGSSIVTLMSEEPLSEIYVGVEGVNGYYRYNATTQRARERNLDNLYMYNVVLLASQTLDQSFSIQITARSEAGEIMQSHSFPIEYLEAGTGALQISLSFNNDKDVDLYVVQPDGKVIYYGNRGNIIDNDSVKYGLDIDSNAGCDIDGINNENIFYPSQFVQSGKYEVWVNMYSNCDPSTVTSWVIATTYKNNLILPQFGTNPASGIFPVNEPSNPIGSSLNDAKKVMEFTITDGTYNPSEETRIQRDVTESAKRKLREAGEM